MNRYFKNISMFGLGVLTLASCDGAMDEITSLVLDRDLAPIGLTTGSVTETTAELKWTASAGAGSYVIEVYQDDSLTFKAENKKADVTSESNDVILKDLVYDTKYSVRVTAKDTADANRDSKASELYFRTNAQQKFYDIVPETDVLDTKVILKWKVGETGTDVTKIVIRTAEDGKEAVSHDITDEEKTTGVVKIDGLTPKTKYEAFLYFGEKERGDQSFETIAALDGTTVVSADDDLKSLIENATDGQVFSLAAGTYLIPSDDNPEQGGSVVVNKNITIQGIYPTSKPVIQGYFQINDGVSLNISNAVLDGSNNSTPDQAFVFKTGGAVHKALNVQDSEIKGYAKGVFYLNVAATVNELTFNNCLIHDVECDGGDMFDSRKGRIDKLTISNSTIYNSCAGRDFIRMDDASSLGGTPLIKVDHCTIDGVVGSSNKRMLYVRYGGNGGHTIEWNNNIVTNVKGVWSNQSKTTPAAFDGNVYFNCPKLNFKDGPTSEGGTGTNLFVDEKKTEANPDYKDAAKGDFTVLNTDVINTGAGDPRWRK